MPSTGANRDVTARKSGLSRGWTNLSVRGRPRIGRSQGLQLAHLLFCESPPSRCRVGCDLVGAGGTGDDRDNTRQAEEPGEGKLQERFPPLASEVRQAVQVVKRRS